MKNFFFAIMLGVATLGTFSSCSKDDFSEVVIPVEDMVKIDLVSKYATTGSIDFPVLTFYYELELIAEKNDIFLPVEKNINQIFSSMSQNVEIQTEDFIVLLNGERLEPVDNLYHIRSGEKYQVVYVLDAQRVVQCMYETRIEEFIFQTTPNGERKAKNFPVDMGLRIFVQ